MVEDIEHKGLALLILAGAQFMVVLDATIVNVALPSIQRSLQFASTSKTNSIMAAIGGDLTMLNYALVQGFHVAFTVASGLAIAASFIALVGLQSTRPSREEIAHKTERQAEGFTVVPGV